MTDMETRCLFEKLYSCSDKDPLSQATAERIIKASMYGDGLHIGLEEQQEKSHITSVPVHRKSVDNYCHKKSIQKALRDKAKVLSCPSTSDLTHGPKRARRSEQLKFVFLQHCVFCGEKCDVIKDQKNPARWRPAYVCRQGETFENRGLKDAILDVCEKRKDTQSEQIRLRIGGVLTDLHAADVQYHVDCKATFMSTKSIQAAQRSSTPSTADKDTAFDSVVDYVTAHKDNIYNSIDIYTKYVEEGGNMLTRRQQILKIVKQFGDDLITLSSPDLDS